MNNASKELQEALQLIASGQLPVGLTAAEYAKEVLANKKEFLSSSINGSGKEPCTSLSDLPDVLRIVDGELALPNGNLREYLCDFATRAKVTPDTPIVIMRRDSHDRDRRDAIMMRSWGS